MKKERTLKELFSLKDLFSLKGKNVVIFGGAGKMSQSFARALLFAECKNLILVDLSKDKLEEAADNLSREFEDQGLHVHVCDVLKKDQLEETTLFIKDRVQKVDVLIYAVMSKPKEYYAPLPDYPQNTWNEALDGNLSGAFYVTQSLLPLFNPSASIIFVGSTYGIVAPDFRIYENMDSNIYGGKYPLTLPAVYSASKAGLTGLAKYLAVYLAEKDIRANVLVPGGVYDDQEENFYKEYTSRVPLKRMAAWTDYNGAVVFLASDSSRYMTGQLLVVDGGWSVW